MPVTKKRKSKFIPNQIFIARNIDGTIELFSSEPCHNTSGHWYSSLKYWIGFLDDSFYPGLTFENSPKQLKL